MSKILMGVAAVLVVAGGLLLYIQHEPASLGDGAARSPPVAHSQRAGESRATFSNVRKMSGCSANPSPGAEWERADPTRTGWDLAGLERAKELAEGSSFAAGLLVHDGRIVWKFGDIARPFQTRSIRKSLYNALIGQLVEEGKLSLDATLASMGLDDEPPLTEQEKSATLRDLLMSRSGVYHGAAYSAPSDSEEQPARGAFGPGEHFWYNNWDFNALGGIAERAAGGDLFAAFTTRIAYPIDMQDYSPASGTRWYDKESIHPAHLFDLSARDRARFGWLYLQNGCWNGKQVVPAQWVRTSISPLTDRSANGEMDYGYLWWSQQGVGDMKGRLVMARGNANQYITLMPEVGAVLVIVNDMDRPGWINWIRKRTHLVGSFEDYLAISRAIIDARPKNPIRAKP